MKLESFIKAVQQTSKVMLDYVCGKVKAKSGTYGKQTEFIK